MNPGPNEGHSESLLKLFKSIAGPDMEVDWMELKRILDHSMKDDLPKSTSYTPYNYNVQNADVGGGGPAEGGGMNILALICGPFCKGTPFESIFSEGNEQNPPNANQTKAGGYIGLPPVIMEENTNGFSKDVCRSMVAMMDVDQSGKLGFEEFEALLTDIAKWKAVFKLYDPEQTGRIDGFKLRDALNSAGYHLNNRILNALAHRYGSRDGKISFDDFLMCAVKIRTYIDIFKQRDTENKDVATFSMDEWIEKTIYS